MIKSNLKKKKIRNSTRIRQEFSKHCKHFFFYKVIFVRSQVTGQLLDTEFQPTVTATCKSGHMTIRVNLNQSFVGAVHARDFRTPQCMAPGNGSTHATLAINLLAPKGSPDYCGVLVNNVSYPLHFFD